MWDTAETVAAQIVEVAKYDPSTDPFAIPKSMGLRVGLGRRGCQATVWRDEVIVDPAARPVRQRFDAIHETIHLVYEAQGEDPSEQLVNATTCATLCPRAPFLAAMRRHGWAPELLAADFPWASQETLARRIVSLRPAVLWVWDVGPRRRRYRVASPEWHWPARRPLPVELEAMEGALEDRCAVEPIGGVRAWPVVDGEWVRVLCLSDAESLAAYLD